jgi:hypothetical protein
MSRESAQPVPPGLERYPRARVESALGAVNMFCDISRAAFKSITHEEVGIILPQIREEAMQYMHSLSPLVDAPQLFGTRCYAARGLEATIYSRNAADNFVGHDALLELCLHPTDHSIRTAIETLKGKERMAAEGEETPITSRIINTVLLAALFELHKEQIRYKKNPYLHLLKLYSLGVTNVQLRPVRFETKRVDEEKLVVDIPFVNSGGALLACEVIGSNEEQLRSVVHAHGWSDDCRERRPFIHSSYKVL